MTELIVWKVHRMKITLRTVFKSTLTRATQNNGPRYSQV